MAGLWGTYGPGLLASGAMLLRQAQTSAAQAAANANAQAGSARRQSGGGSASERRRQLEAELASLQNEGVTGYDMSSAMSSPAFESVPMPPADNPSRNSSSGSLRERTGRSTFEEVEVPSDMEGEGAGSPRMPDAARRSSWFGWGGGASEYERVKTD